MARQSPRIPDAPAALPAVVPSRSRSRTLKGLALLLAAVWVGTLIVLTLVASNPVTLNWDQVRQAPLIVTARVVDRASGECAVERVWRNRESLPSVSASEGGTSPALIRVHNLAAAKARQGETYLLPLRPLPGGGFEIVPLRRPASSPLIYPASEDAEQQLQRLLGERG